ncbi:hypothetical protein [Streptomyces sp. NPDC005336]|uniref:hypothetical protein n=1 Tax=Streptomyces sp. NPDC005336 TaxID=3157035 RepID=UPI0033AA4FE4
MPKPLRRKRNSPAEEHQPALTPFEVQITESGDCTIGGLPVAPSQNEALHDSVLNHLHRLAMATGHPVRATVHDARSGFVTPIEVRTDGSSQFAGEPERMPQREAFSAASAPSRSMAGDPPREPLPRPEVHSTGPAAQGDWLSKGKPGMGNDQGQQDSVDLPPPLPHTRVAFVSEGLEPSRPEGGEGPQEQRCEPPGSVGEPAPGGVPPGIADAVTRINQALQRGHIEFAAMTGQHSLTSAAQEFGSDHPHVLELQELCAHIAYVAGDASRSMTMALEVARSRQRLGDPSAYATLMRAAAVWPAIGDPREGLECGRALVAVWSALAREGGQAAADIGRLDAAKRRMVRLAQRASEQGAGPSHQGPGPETPGATVHGAG